MLNLYARHGATRRLLNERTRYRAGELSDDFFFDRWLKEPALTPQEAKKYGDAVKAARFAKQPKPLVSEVLSKKPSPQEVLRRRYGIATSGELRKAVTKGDFSFEEFFTAELARNEGGLDLGALKSVVSDVLKSGDPDVNITELAASFKAYRGSIRTQQSAQRKAINKWYEDTLENAKRLQLIDKNKTNRVQLGRLDTLQKQVDTNKFKTQQLAGFYRDWSGDLEEYFGINNLSELDAAFKNGNFKIREFLAEQNDRYRELTSADMLRALKEGEDRYGIGP